MVRGRFLAALLVVVTLMVASGVMAQGGAGDLTGVVYDQTGAVVPKAKVTLSNQATGFARTVETSDSGVYRFVALPVVGTYKLKVEAGGFKTFEIPNVAISVGRVTTEDINLEVGSASATVTVEAGTELVQTSDSQLSGLIDQRAWQSLPLEARNQNTFINLLAGVVPDDFGGTTRGAAVNGIRPGSGNFMVEGFDNNDQGQGGRGAAVASGAITSISPEAIQEYRVVTGVFAAEFGKAGGFVNNTALKSGTNQWHGSAFLYNRVQALAANSFFSNKDNVEDQLVRNQFGASMGGPLVADKSFVYGSYEGHTRRQAFPTTTTGTTQQFVDFVRTGAFRTFHETNANGVCVVYTGVTCVGAFANSASLGSIFTAATAVQSFPVAQATANCATLPTPTNCIGAGAWTAGIIYPVQVYGSVTELTRDKFNEQRFSIKADHRFTPSSTLSYTMLFHDHDGEQSNTGGDGAIGAPILNPGRTILTGLTWQHSFTPLVLNQARFGYLRNRSDFPEVPGLAGVPSIVTAFDPVGVSLGQGSALPQFFTENQFQVKDDLSVVKGRHTFKAGAEYRRTRNGSSFQALKNGLFLPYGIEEMLTDGFFGDEADLAIVGYPYYGAFYYGQASVNPVTATVPEFYRGFRANEWAAFVQDDWKIHSRLTINLGLRYEYFGPPHNFRPGLDSNFYFGNPITPVTPTSANLFWPTTSTLAARVQNGAFQQRDHSIWNKDLNNFAPRFGFAWDTFGTAKFVVRGGYAISYDRMWNNLFENIRFNAPFFSFATIGPFTTGTPIGPLSAPGILTSPFTSNGQFATFGGVPSPRHMDQDLVTAYTQQFFLGTQWEFAKNFVFETNYTSTLGNKLLGVIDINTFNGRTRGGGSARINTSIAGDNFRSNAFRSNYHGLQMIVRKNFSNGLQFNANYTWSHALDTLSDAFNNARGQILRPTNNFNVRNDYGNADFDIRHRFVVSYYYELPWGRGNRWLGGWNFGGIVTLQKGTPVQLFDSAGGGDANADGYRTDRPFYRGSGDINSIVQNNVSPADGYFNPDITATGSGPFRRIAANGSDCPAGSGQFISATRWWCDSPLGRNGLIGPGYVNFDFNVAKDFKLTERVKMQFQANFFNLFNHTNFVNPVGNLNSSNFGKSLAAFQNRVTQLAVRFDF
jgi:hypothetical protein